MTKSKKKTEKKKTYKEIIAVISWVTVIFLWISAASVFIPPTSCRYFCILGLGFPFFLAVVVAMLLISLLLAFKKSWIPMLGLVGCFFSIRDYCPVNIPSAPPKDALKIMSYNTLGFATSTKDSVKEEGILNYINQNDNDLFCFQEGGCTPQKLLHERVLPKLKKTMRYNDTIKLHDGVIGCCSKYRIVKKEKLCEAESSANGAGVFHVLLGEKDTLRLVNCHLQSMGLNQDERNNYHNIVKNMKDKEIEEHSRLLLSKISKASVPRSLQADIVARYIERNSGKNIVVCGDFNDTPISYTHHRIHSTGLTDMYSATSNGIGRSFNRDAIFVRIDHMFCSDHWKPYSCRIDNTTNASDHYPIIGYLKRIKEK